MLCEAMRLQSPVGDFDHERVVQRVLADSRRPPAIVVGLALNGLGTVRALGRRNVKVLALADGRAPASEATRFADVIKIPDLMTRAGAATEVLASLAPRFPIPPVVFVSSDLFLEEFADWPDDLRRRYRIPMADPAIVKLILSKQDFYAYCLKERLPIPQTAYPHNEGDIEAISRDFR